MMRPEETLQEINGNRRYREGKYRQNILNRRTLASASYLEHGYC